MDCRSIGRRRTCKTFCRGVDEQQGDGLVSDPAAKPLHDVGLGRRSLLFVVGSWPIHCARTRHGSIRAHSRRRPRDGRALSDCAVREKSSCVDGTHRRLESQLPRFGFTRSAALRTTVASLPRLFAATRNGIQRKTDNAGRATCRV
jgi:hypothetical protein